MTKIGFDHQRNLAMSAPQPHWELFSDDERDLIEQALRVLKQIRFGSVEIVVHDGDIVQFERREKVRRHGKE